MEATQDVLKDVMVIGVNVIMDSKNEENNALILTNVTVDVLVRTFLMLNVKTDQVITDVSAKKDIRDLH